jgi:hypothetical protein
MDEKSAVQQLIGKLGSQEALAAAAEVTQQAVSYWSRRLPFIPVKHARLVSEKTGIPLHELCPEYFPAPTGEQGDAAS